MSFSDVGMRPANIVTGIRSAKHSPTLSRVKRDTAPTLLTGFVETDFQFSASSHHEPTIDQSRIGLVRAKENITLALRYLQIVVEI